MSGAGSRVKRPRLEGGAKRTSPVRRFTRGVAVGAAPRGKRSPSDGVLGVDFLRAGAIVQMAGKVDPDNGP